MSTYTRACHHLGSWAVLGLLIAGCPETEPEPPTTAVSDAGVDSRGGAPAGTGGSGGSAASGGSPGHVGAGGVGGTGSGGENFAGSGGLGGQGGYGGSAGQGGYGGFAGQGGYGGFAGQGAGGAGGGSFCYLGGAGGYGGIGGSGFGGQGGTGTWIPVQGGTGGFPATSDPARDALAEAFCTASDRCCQFGQGQVGQCRGEICPRAVSTAIGTSFVEMRRSTSMGRARLDEAALAACTARLKIATCSDLSPLLQGTAQAETFGCEEFVTGLVTDGGSCDRSFECAAGLYCDGANCRPKAGAGEACAGRPCGDGLFCRWLLGGPERCVQKEPDGRLCERNEECTSGLCQFDPTLGIAICGAANVCAGR